MVVLRGTTQGRQTVIRNSRIARQRQVEPVEASAGIQILRGWTEATMRLLACQILTNQVVSGYAFVLPDWRQSAGRGCHKCSSHAALRGGSTSEILDTSLMLAWVKANQVGRAA
ncbi:hypothetical protein GB937_008751 [Aspergillus fischeri]|nr:hypothetical protein GB937_008751 [Aspergillus fischeri]